MLKYDQYEPLASRSDFALIVENAGERDGNCMGVVKKGDDLEKTKMKNEEILEKMIEVRESTNGVTMMWAPIEQVEAYMRQAYNIPSRILCKVVHFRLEDTTQDIVAEDLHGKLWRFHHIYDHGNLKQYLLSTLTKMLVIGDICTFIGGEREEIYFRLGHDTQPGVNPSTCVMSSINMQHGIPASAFHALSTGTMFTVYYHPRTNPCDDRCDKFMKSAEIDFALRT